MVSATVFEPRDPSNSSWAYASNRSSRATGKPGWNLIVLAPFAHGNRAFVSRESGKQPMEWRNWRNIWMEARRFEMKMGTLHKAQPGWLAPAGKLRPICLHGERPGAQ